MRKNLVLGTLQVTFFRSDFLVAIQSLTLAEIEGLPTKKSTFPRKKKPFFLESVMNYLEEHGFLKEKLVNICIPFAKFAETAWIRYVPGSLCPILTTKEGKPVVAYSKRDYDTLKCTVERACYSGFKITKLKTLPYPSETFHAEIDQYMIKEILEALIRREKVINHPEKRVAIKISSITDYGYWVPPEEAEHFYITRNCNEIRQLTALPIIWDRYVPQNAFKDYMNTLLEIGIPTIRPGGFVPCIHIENMPFMIFPRTEIMDTEGKTTTRNIEFELWFPLSLRISSIPGDDKKLMDEFMNTAQEVCQEGITAFFKKNPDAMKTITKFANNSIAEKEFTRETITEALLLLAFLSNGAIEERENKVILDAPALGDRLEFTSFMKTATSIEETELLFRINKLLFQNYLKEAGISVKDDSLVISKERLLAQLVT